VAVALAEDLEALLESCTADEPYRFEPAAIGRRAVAGLCLDYLVAADAPRIQARCLQRYFAADNMTDRVAALSALRDCPGDAREAAFADFKARGSRHALVLDKWFALQAASRLPDGLERMRELTRHPQFTLANPNRVRALLGGFSRANPAVFHRADGAGYALLADQVLALDRLNPQVAARLVTALTDWRRYAWPQGEAMRTTLQRIQRTSALSADVFEMVDQALTG
ncbi:MAG: aminopeptidase N C-terminal domain-containing protein, partial [Salinisphaera sp.]|nr:aminopeptidase N C-terminal domain-containing protein [Salinisphaera sp.]